MSSQPRPDTMHEPSRKAAFGGGLDRLLEAIITRTSGAPRGEPREFYRDIALAVVFAFSSIVVIGHGFQATFKYAFWIAAAISVVCIAVAKSPRLLITSLLAILAVRFTFGALVRTDVTLGLLAVAAAASALAVARLGTR